MLTLSMYLPPNALSCCHAAVRRTAHRPGWVAMRLLQPGRLMGDEEVVRRLVGGP